MNVSKEERARRAANMKSIQVERNRLIELGRYAESIGIKLPEIGQFESGQLGSGNYGPTLPLPPPPLPPLSGGVVIPLPARGRLSAEIEAALARAQRGNTE